ncbi:hypothetical protein PVK06_030454 [Gossypium arboreum]|uniref:HTH La-type RNA-binding domain-containing protein n=1 Tax=Gossypium arboreum TaxID=29729 RepID=A0ABR0NNB8_GOSAR|nr:hypothetical protein PVK06_030454 [Gossypium arboreum]
MLKPFFSRNARSFSKTWKTRSLICSLLYPQSVFPAPEPHDNQLHASIVNLIDYYFSNENLIKDTYLRQNMDDQGWVPIKLIAGLKKVSLLTDNIQLITDALQSSTVVEVQGDQVRKRIDWMRWIMPPSVHFPTKSGQDTLAARVQNISLDQRAANQSGESNPEDSDAGRPSYGDFSNQLQLFNNEGSTVTAHGGPAMAFVGKALLKVLTSSGVCGKSAAKGQDL